MTVYRIDLSGQRFGMLVVRRRSFGQHWFVDCDCGNSKTVLGYNLKSGRTKSCGCQERAPGRSKARPGYPTWLSQLWQEYTAGARNRNLDFGLSLEQLRELAKSNCHYCGRPPQQRQSSTAPKDMVVNGIDRIDSKIGYNISNCVPCCEVCNRMKMAISYEDFIRHILKIASHVSK